MSTQFDPSTLVHFPDAAAGHEGVLSDPTGVVVVKPCTETEIQFYESANTSHPQFARFMPAFMGTLKLGSPDSHLPEASTTSAGSIQPASVDGPSGTAPEVVGLRQLKNLPATHPPSTSTPPDVEPSRRLRINDPGPLKGKHLDTDLHIVLENIASGFKEPNILDLKLGAQLWDDAAKPEKRARLDKVASETTSGSLGFRIAGMRVWQGPEKATPPPTPQGERELYAIDDKTNVLTYNKFYGRTFTEATVKNGFAAYLSVPSAGVTKPMSLAVTQSFLAEVQEIEQILEAQESRMYSASILLVYEGDPVAWKEATEADARYEDDDTEDEDEDEVEKKPFAVKLIDFAHASWTPGAGPDKNMLQGVRSTIKILQELEKDFS